MYKEIAKRVKDSKHIFMLTGAGISAPSNVPIFRGKDGMWTKMNTGGNDPMYLLTRRVFEQDPAVIWNWIINFKSITAKAKTNDAHFGVLKLQEYCREHKKKFTLVTQTLDNFHA